MDETKYFKASCAQCGNHIEFPDAALGRMVDCPHCGQRTQLRVDKKGPPEPPQPATSPPPSEEETSQPSGSRINLPLIAASCAIIALAAGAFFWKKHQAQPPPATSVSVKVKEPITNASLPVTSPSPATNPPPAPTLPAVPTQPKALSDLKAGDIQLEKAKGSSLVYAVGQLDNNSDYQRFGVKIQLDMLNKAGEKIGTAQDYVPVLEPRKSWHFRALVTDSKAVACKVASIKEDE